MYTVYSDKHEVHDTSGVMVEGRPLASFEVPTRADAILSAVRQASLGPIIAPDDHGLEPILAAHDAGYVAFLRGAYDDQAAYYGEEGPVMVWTFASRHAMHKPQRLAWQKGYYAFGWGTPILAGTWQAAYWSAQCALTAAGLVRGGEALAYALCRPPGHHAGPDLYGGYCYLNNAAIAARFLQDGGQRVAILDVDYHHGNGTQLIFYADPTVFYASLHADPEEEYPYYWGSAAELGEGPGFGTNRNWPLPRGSDDTAYLAALDEALAEVRAFAPGYLVLSLGLDTVGGDPEGGFCLSPAGLAEMARRTSTLGLPIVVVQEGGYVTARLGGDAVTFLRALCSP
ncbi:MAG: histone deacetylase family protein [Anaerolineae bacterium]|jgi:acetoin utilization deacetylase AcuC-like enzyme